MVAASLGTKFVKITVPSVVPNAAGAGATCRPGPELHTGLGKSVVSRLRELAPLGQRESGGGIHAT